MANPTIIFAGGGTGGHIFPAVAIAERLLAREPGAHVRLLVSTRPLDASILAGVLLAGKPAAFTPIPAQPLGLRPGPLLRFVSHWGSAVRAGREAIRSGRGGPVVVVAMGGFVAAPVVQAARAERVPTILVNLDAVPGKANRWIARHARRVLTAAALAPGEHRPAWETIPPIVRERLLEPRNRGACRASFGLDPDRPTLLVSGGSQGAASINALAMALARAGETPLRAWQVIHQCGKGAADEVRRGYDDVGVRAWVGEFIADMGSAWGAAEAAILRAGAGNVAEAWATRTPALFLPYPGHADQHQKHNAMRLVGVGGGLLGEDRGPSAIDHLLPLAASLVRDDARRDAMREALAALGPVDGAARAASAILELAR